jgi:hypothetical protein
MNPSRRRTPFVVFLIVLAIVCLAVLRLPESFLSQLRNNKPLDDVQADWVYRLLVFVALAQAIYGGFGILQTERVRKARERDEKTGSMSKEEIVASLARNAAGMCALTMIYGLAALGLTGQRGGFWVFPGIALLQAAWYMRQVAEVARWIEFQPAFVMKEGTKPEWDAADPDYTPPIARGLSPAGNEGNRSEK